MSSRRAEVRKNFNSAMNKADGLAIRNTPANRRIEPFSGSDSGPSHPAFDRLEEMKIKQLEEVTFPAFHSIKGLSRGLTAL